SSMSGVEIESSEGLDIEKIKGSKSGSIEVVSPSDVGPTIEMKVEKNRVKFKAAGEDEIKALKAREDAAQKIVSVQKLTSTLKGIGGDASRIIENVRNMAISYRDGKYDAVISGAEKIEERMASEETKKSIIVQLQKKVSDYEEIGGDLTMAKERFKQMVVSLKEGKDDLYSLAQSTNKMAEDAIKDLVTVEEVELAEPVQVKEEKEPKKPAKEEKPKAVRRIVRKKQELPGDAAEDTSPEEEPEAEPKPVIKIIKKKIIVIRTHDEVETDDGSEDPSDLEDDDEEFSLDLDVEEDLSDLDDGMDNIVGSADPDETVDSPNLRSGDFGDPSDLRGSVREEKSDEGEELVKDTEQKPQVREVNPEPEVRPAPEVSAQPDPTPRKEEPAQQAPERKEASPGTKEDEIKNAFKQYQFVYNAALKLHSAGKDVTQIFDLYSYGESARQKEDMKTYVGIGKQLQDMLIALQK
ncbi:MAG: hypothetical protein U9R75_08605, partial [Candidatus Thermoplasmatota archaeon]|nr:hypothetical protein [Candidatus Thermoplasmatota archaeon]